MNILPYISDDKSTKLAVIADDLTGALDSTAPFAGRGLVVEVALTAEAAPEVAASGADIIVINTASRELSAEAAHDAVARAASAIPAGLRLFKKVDSRLKGHVVPEISALTFTHALAAPAIPAFGRIVRGGMMTGFGVDRPISVVAALGPHAARADIPDTNTDVEMRAALVASHAELLIGARGLAEALALQMTGRPKAELVGLSGPDGVMVIGSRDPITMAQVAALRATRNPHYLPAPNGVFSPDPRAGLVLVQALPAEHEIAGAEVAANLARGLHPAMTERCGTLFLTGGATAEAVLSAMGITRMRLLGECLPGIAVATAKGLTIVTKSGGFGDDATLLQIAAMIEQGGKG